MVRRRVGRVGGLVPHDRAARQPARPRLPDWCTGNRVEPLIHGATYFDRLADRGGRAAPRRLPVLHRLARRPRRADARRRPDHRRAVLPRRRTRRRRQGPAVALASGQARLQRGGEPASRRRDRRRPAARCCSTSGCASAARITRSWSCCAIPAHPSATSPSPAASTCATAAATTRSTAGIRRRCRWPRRTASNPPWHDVQLRLHGPGRRRAGPDVPRTLDRPGTAGQALADRLDRRQAAPRRPAAPASCHRSRPTRRRAGRRPCRCCGPIPMRHFEYAFAPHGERSVARGYTKAMQAGHAG